MTEISRRVEPVPAPDPRLLTFLIADVRGYTAFTVEHGNDEAARLASTFAAIAEEVVAGREGTVVELRGDEALAVFPTPHQAIYAAVELQHRFEKHTEIDPTLPLKVGMGIDIGEAVPVKGGYRGLALNLAARLCSLSGPGEVYGSEMLVELAPKLEGLAYVERGRVRLKGFPDTIRVIQILPEDELPAGFPPLVSPVARPSNLPLQLTPFIGRQREVAAASHLLRREEVRLLTLTGPGGTGKTRLALHVAEMVSEDFERGVYFVSLASVSDFRLIAPTIAGTLKVKERPGQPLLDTLQDYLHDKKMLLVVDNFEHLTDGAVTISELLGACPNLKVLVTSRGVLNLLGEYDYPVPPLEVPDPTQLPNLDALTENDAVALFVDRARAVKPAFSLTNENASAVAEICRRLDGLPLALELAAARIRLLPPPALLARLSSRLKLLIGGARDAPARQQTLRGTIDWSYSLLNAAEQRLLAEVGVFGGGCSLEAAEAVCTSEGSFEVLEGIGSLVEKSLLRQVGENAPRFLMLETIREYALEQLEASGEAEHARERHAAFYLNLVEQGPGVVTWPHGTEQVQWFDRLEAEHHNLRGALEWFLQHGDLERELRLAVALRHFWHAHAHFGEGRRWLEIGLAHVDAVSVPVRITALNAAGSLAMIQGDQTRAVALMEELLPLTRKWNDSSGTIGALTVLGMTAVQRGDHEQATRCLEECVTLARADGSRFTVAHALYNLGLAKSEEGIYAEALALIEEALAACRETGDTFWAMNATGSLGYIALLEGRYQPAQGLLQEYLEMAHRFEDRANVAAGLEGLAAHAAAEGQLERAAHLFAAAESLRHEIGSRLMSLRNRTMIEHTVRSTRERLGEEAWLAAWEDGLAMSMEQAISLASAT